MAHKEKGYRFHDDWTEEEVIEFHAAYKDSITIPVGIEVEAKNTVLNFGHVFQYLKDANTIVVQDCICRVTKGFCDSPLDVCILLDETAEKRLREPEKNSHEISYEEALKVLRKGNDSGLCPDGVQKRRRGLPQNDL